MNASAFATRLRIALVLGVAGLTGACSSVESFIPSAWTNAKTADTNPNSGPVSPSDKVVKLPMSGEDLNCPRVDVEDGAAAYRVGGADNGSVRYQFGVAQVARECQPQGSNFALKVGVSGRLLIGPAGSPGAYSAPLHVTVRREGDPKPVFSKVYKVEANTAGADQAPYEFVAEPIILPMVSTDLDSVYTVSVGFENGHVAPAKPPRKRHTAQNGNAD
jgi:hypothetical protein